MLPTTSAYTTKGPLVVISPVTSRSGARTEGFAVLGVRVVIRGLPSGRVCTLGALAERLAQHELPLRHMQLLLL